MKVHLSGRCKKVNLIIRDGYGKGGSCCLCNGGVILHSLYRIGMEIPSINRIKREIAIRAAQKIIFNIYVIFFVQKSHNQNQNLGD